MKGYYDLRLSNDLTLAKNEAYNIAYEYDGTGRISKETVTGSTNRVVDYTYDVNDNIVMQVIAIDEKVITKTYTYDEHNNITGVTVVVA